MAGHLNRTKQSLRQRVTSLVNQPGTSKKEGLTQPTNHTERNRQSRKRAHSIVGFPIELQYCKTAQHAFLTEYTLTYIFFFSWEGVRRVPIDGVQVY